MTRTPAPHVLLTGATGFLGHYLLAALLSAKARCTVLLRPPVEASFRRLAGLLAELGVDADGRLSAGDLDVVVGALPEALPSTRVNSSDVLIHAAAATNFQHNERGDPTRTNVEGTRAVIEWADRLGLRRIHLVSSAYTCGRTEAPVTEAFNPDPPPFHNEYEQSKWESERLAVEWARRSGGEITIHRPSIIAGAYDTGRSTRFGGFYVSARATELVDRRYREHSPAQRQSIPLRIVGRPLDRQNIVPVDYVARMIAAAATTAAAGGTMYHLVHPNPPTNLQIKQALEQYFSIGGGRFVSPEDMQYDELNDMEQAFYDVVRPIEHYFVDTPAFCRENTAKLERQAGMECPPYDAPALWRLVRYAQSTSWGRRARSAAERTPGCSAYFESFLPFHVAKSSVARMTAISATVSFIIDDEPDGRWVCTFDRGRLADVYRGANGVTEDFGYRTTRDVFWESVSGRHHPQELFLTGRAEIFGDVERALKMSMVLHSFTREFPCDPNSLARFVGKPCLPN